MTRHNHHHDHNEHHHHQDAIRESESDPSLAADVAEAKSLKKYPTDRSQQSRRAFLASAGAAAMLGLKVPI